MPTQPADRKLKICEHILSRHRLFARIKNIVTLFGMGMYFWLDYLWGLIENYLKEFDESIDKWYINWFFEKPLRIYPIIEALDKLSFIFFIVAIVYAAIWIYIDTYARRAYGEKVWPFTKQIAVALLVNIITYIALRLLTFALWTNL